MIKTDIGSLHDGKPPYESSWIDRFISWIDRLPGPAWLFYVLSVLFLVILANAIFWIDGSLQMGSIDPFLSVNGVLVVYWLALYHYFTRTGSQSLRSFRPLLEVGDDEIARIDYELSTLPRGLGWLAIPLGMGFSLMDILGNPEPYGSLVAQTDLPVVSDFVFSGFMVTTFFCLVIRSIKQLRMVRKLHSQATNINLLNLGPAHAFSILTARTGLGVFFVLILGYFLDPSALSTGFDVATSVLVGALAAAIFVLPIIGIRAQIEEAKERALIGTSELLQEASDDLHSKVSRKAYADFSGIEDTIGALIRERELFKKTQTWPWNPGTLRGFASTLLLPIFVWIVTRLLERFI